MVQHLGQVHEDGVISEWGTNWRLVSEVEDIHVSPGVKVIHVLSRRDGTEGKNIPLRS